MEAIPLQCGQMARVAGEYCRLIDDFEPDSLGRAWWLQLEKVLPRLHVAVIALVGPHDGYAVYSLPDDEQRFELYMRLHDRFYANPLLWSSCSEYRLLARLCDRLADDLTDMYFDLQRGLNLLEAYPSDPGRAVGDWQNSFYRHWAQHLLNAERWLHTVDATKRGSVGRPWQTMVV